MVEEQAVLKGADRYFNCLAFSPDGSLLAAGQQDGTVKIWECPSGAEWLTVSGKDVPVYRFEASVSSLSFSPDGKALAWAARNPVVSLLDVKTKKPIGQLSDPESAVTLVRFHPTGKSLATATEIKHGVVRLWDIEMKKSKVLFDEQKSKAGQPNCPQIGCIAFDPTGKFLALGIFGKIVLVDVATGNEMRVIQGHESLMQTLVFAPDGKTLVGANGGKISFWHSESGNEVSHFSPHYRNAGTRSLAFSPKGDMLAVGRSGAVHQRSMVEIWDVKETALLATFVCHQEILTAVDWSPDGTTLATASTDKTVRLWKLPKELIHR